MRTTLNVLSLIIAILSVVATQPIIPPLYLPYILALVAVLNVTADFLRVNYPAVHARLGFVAK